MAIRTKVSRQLDLAAAVSSCLHLLFSPHDILDLAFSVEAESWAKKWVHMAEASCTIHDGMQMVVAL